MTVKLGPGHVIEALIVIVSIWLLGVTYGSMRTLKEFEPQIRAARVAVDELAVECQSLEARK